MSAAVKAVGWSEQGLVPDAVIRHGIRHLLKTRLEEIHAADCDASARLTNTFVQTLRTAPIALLPDKANEQHYEVPAQFFRHVLGPRLKYSCGYWDSPAATLADAEAAALRQTCEHAHLADGMSVLELGCGWGSLTLWMAEKFPHSRITAVSNSRSQRAYILARAASQGLHNVEVVVRDMNDFDTTEQYHRVVSVEMFEHMRNYPRLLQRIHDWLVPGGQFFMHIFCHRSTPYAFEDNGPGDWMSRHFFSGGMMPSDDLPLHFQDHLRFAQRWRWAGTHYTHTANAWLANMDAGREQLWPILEQVYGPDATQRWWMRWRMFFMACAELFGYRDGQEWWVSHYRFERRRSPQP